MQNQPDPKINKFYLGIIISLMLVLPLISVIVDAHFFQPNAGLLLLTGKWFLFCGIGMRLFTAGIRQAIKPQFTAQDIFHLTDTQSYTVVRELSFANVCLGFTAILSLFIPAWRIGAAFAGGLYMGMAGMLHVIKRPNGPNEVVAMISDLFIFLLMGIYVYTGLC